MKQNIDKNTVDGFGYEWTVFDQTSLSTEEIGQMFETYFSIFDWTRLSQDAVGFDLGCGSGRWAKLVAPKVGHLHLIDASSEALMTARKNMQGQVNCSFHAASVDQIPLDDKSMDFGYSLGVLHHIPHTQQALISCTDKLKPGAPFLAYFYYAFDNKPKWFQMIWKISDLMRKVISVLPNPVKYMLSQAIALLIYWPLARSAKFLENVGFSVDNFPLSTYRNNSFYTMRTDAFDRFATRLEQRFTKKQIQVMMETADLERIVFSEKTPFWCCVGYKKA